jgi:hypothetical protein
MNDTTPTGGSSSRESSRGMRQSGGFARRAARVLLFCGFWLSIVIALVAAGLLVVSFQRSIGVKTGRGFEIRVIADHVIVSWRPGSLPASLTELKTYAEPYRCSWPCVILFSPGSRPPTRSFAIPLWVVLAGAIGLALVAWWVRSSLDCRRRDDAGG